MDLMKSTSYSLYGKEGTRVSVLGCVEVDGRDFIGFQALGRVWLQSVKFLKMHLSTFEVLNID